MLRFVGVQPILRIVIPSVIDSDGFDPDVQIACIGPAGENLVSFACVRTGIQSASGRGGMGVPDLGEINLAGIKWSVFDGNIAGPFGREKA